MNSSILKADGQLLGAGTILALVSSTGLACGASADSTRRPGHDEDPTQMLERMMSREHGPYPRHALNLLDGAIQGEVEAKVAPRPECESEESGGFSCQIDLEMGKDADGDENSITCFASTHFAPFGPLIKIALGASGLTETPELQAQERGEGIAMTFVANTAEEDETSYSVGTHKIASLYAHGYMVQCVDTAPGGRETFARVVGDLFESLKFRDSPTAEVLFSMGYRIREGDRTVGFRYAYVSKDENSESNFVENATYFQLETDGKTWSVVDTGEEIVREYDGTIDRYSSLYWQDGAGPLVMTAKPSEGGRFRVKSEVGQRSDAIELTPQAPVSSELWSASRLKQLVTGKSEDYIYAEPTVDDGDPSFRYVLLEQGPAGVLLEQVRVHGELDEEPKDADAVRDELHLDDRGIVVKEVTATSVHELVYEWGELPEVMTQAPAAQAPKRKR